ncbi:MAG TPA: hypothetical protein VGX92_07920 [Pyrinomonadaceae bacterium]|jgi:hypothetical protein|nr:hypothetical protein [Pyrinomonadaceae bacterium]
MRPIRPHATLRSLLALAALAMAAAPAPAQVQVVDMIPNAQSNETNQDSEPNITVNPANTLQMAGSAFTPDPMGGAIAPIFVSANGGTTWTLNSIVPSSNGMTGDITLRFGGTSGVLYTGTLRGGSGLTLNILRSTNFTGAAVMDLLVTRGGVDQPYVQAATVFGFSGTGNDRVYVGDNDFNPTTPGRTATVDQHLNATTAMPPPPSGFTIDRIESRSTSGQDGPPIRPAIHMNGTLYAIFYRWTAFSGTAATADVVVVRDDNWGSSGTPFTALTDPSGGPGRLVVTGITVPWNNTSQASFGQERFVGSNITIAVDPRDSSTVYIAWADRPVGTTNYNLHVRRSTDSGATWSAADLLTITNATNPALAINTNGQVGFLYQQLAGTSGSQRWETHLRRSTNGTTWNDLILAQPPANAPTVTFIPYTGDYVHLLAIGKNYYGIFSANNTPDMANFPNGVTYQRNANFTTHQPLNLSNNPVPVSIDPFFFSVTELASENDFYVRDWTDNPASGDTGLEPSTHPVFYATSDVWNRRGTLPGAFPNDQPDNENAGNGVGNIGDNWAFARIRRNTPASSGSKTVTAHFMVSPFGTGSNFVDGTTGPVSIIGPDPAVNFPAAQVGPITTVGQQWHLDAVASTHICMAVELSEPGDPFVAPSLVGSAPGWPTTDIRVINDNNKAQRNLGLSTTPARGVGARMSFYALVHNAATFRRDMVLRYDAPDEVLRRLRDATVEVIGGPGKPFRSGDSVTLPGMQPGENRWVGFSYAPPEGKEGETLGVNFYEMVGNTAVNGFTIAARPSPMGRVTRDNMEMHRSVFTRLAAGFNMPGAREEAELVQRYAGEGSLKDDEYLKLLIERASMLEKALGLAVSAGGQRDEFGGAEALKALRGAVEAGRAPEAAVAHAALLNKLDANLTMLQLAKGNPADILQNVRWQRDLFTKNRSLSSLRCSAQLTEQMSSFIAAYEGRRVTAGDYPALLGATSACLREGLSLLSAGSLGAFNELATPRRDAGDLAAMQKAHRELLLRLQSLR